MRRLARAIPVALALLLSVAAHAEETRAERLAGPGPQYPERALEERREGMARYRFTITAKGTTADLELLDEEPPGYGFGKAGADALRQWRWKPATVNGVPVARTNRTYRLRWTLQEQEPEQQPDSQPQPIAAPTP